MNVDEKSVGAMVGVDVEMGSELSDPPGLSKFYDRRQRRAPPRGSAEIKHGCVWVGYQIRRGVKGSMSLKCTMGWPRLEWLGAVDRRLGI